MDRDAERMVGRLNVTKEKVRDREKEEGQEDKGCGK